MSWRVRGDGLASSSGARQRRVRAAVVQPRPGAGAAAGRRWNDGEEEGEAKKTKVCVFKIVFAKCLHYLAGNSKLGRPMLGEMIKLLTDCNAELIDQTDYSGATALVREFCCVLLHGLAEFFL